MTQYLLLSLLVAVLLPSSSLSLSLSSPSSSSPSFSSSSSLDVSLPFVVPPSLIPSCLAAGAKTPFYAYSSPHLNHQISQALAFPPPFPSTDSTDSTDSTSDVTVRFAMKALPSLSVLRLMRSRGVLIDASSGPEIARAVNAGYSPPDLSLSSQELPSNIADLLAQGVKVNACSLDQLERIGRASSEHVEKGGEPFKCGIRINPGVGSGGFSGSTTGFSKTNVGGPQSSFGIWYSYLSDGTVRNIVEKYGLEVERVHTHIGSGSDPAVWVKVVEKSLSFCAAFDTIKSINLGGGYKVARNPEMETPTDLQEIGVAIRGEFAKFKSEHGRELKLEIEPGTFLTANVGCLVSRVQDKVSTGPDGYTFVKLDSGMTEVLRPSLYGARHPIVFHPEVDNGETEEVVVVGHCCESGDLLSPKDGDPEAIGTRTLKKVQIGDYAVIGGSGGYCSSMNTKNYNSFPEAAEVIVCENGDNDARLIRKTQRLEQMWENEL